MDELMDGLHQAGKNGSYITEHYYSSRDGNRDSQPFITSAI